METRLSKELETQGYTLLKGLNRVLPAWGEILKQYEDDFRLFHQSWNDLPPDDFLSDGGHYRFRRYSVFSWSMKKSELELLPHEPHFQSTYRNNMNGGINRDFEPFKESTINNPIFTAMIMFVIQQISHQDKQKWRIQAHQFRIEANSEEAGQPTPEGIHRDGADFILIMVLDRQNINGGVSHIYDDAKHLIFGGLLDGSGDAVIINDKLVWHGVSEVYPIDKRKKGHRDVLVLTFHNKEFS